MRLFWALLLAASSAPAQEGRFERLMKDLFIADTHIDTPWYIADEGYDMGEEHRYYEADLPRLQRGHVGAVFFGVPVEGNFARELWVPRALQLIDAVHEQARVHSSRMEVAYTADDIERIRRKGKLAALLSIEGGHMIQDSLPVLRDYYRLGIRYMTLTHFKTNNWGDSSTDAAVHNGLSPFGRDVVREMNRLGMLIDISHVSDKTFYDALEISRAPLIASHSSLRALCDIPRNMSDDMIRALAKKGGVVFINFNAAYLDPKAYQVLAANKEKRDREIADMLALRQGDPRRWEMKRAIQRRYRALLPQVTIRQALQHIDHAVKVAGAAHVGFGSDFDGISGMAPQGLEDVSKYPELVKGMIEMGYSDADIRKIAGGNLLRVMRAAEAVRDQASGAGREHSAGAQ